MTYREKGKARSPALEELAATARPTEAPAQTAMLTPAEILRRLELAADVHGDRVGCLPIFALFATMFAFYGLILGARADFRVGTDERVLIILLVVAAIALVAASFYMHEVTRKRRAKGVADLLAWEAAQPFPVTGLRDWIVSDRSVLVVHLRDALDKATFLDAARAVDPAIEGTALSDTAFELVLPSRLVGGESSTRYGDVKLLRTVFEKLVLPVHGDVGVERVAMGGTVHDRV